MRSQEFQFFFFQAEDGIRDFCLSRGLGDVYKRQERMAQEADAVIALPGGCGTMEELFEIITWKQLGLFLNPIVILNIDGYYNPLIEMLHNAIGENFMRQEHARMWQVAQTPQEAVDAIQNMPVWDKNIRKIAAI